GAGPGNANDNADRRCREGEIEQRGTEDPKPHPIAPPSIAFILGIFNGANHQPQRITKKSRRDSDKQEDAERFSPQMTKRFARRVRESGVFSELVRPDISLQELREKNPKAIILSGGPSSVYEANAPRCDPKIFDLGVPILGICYGMQLGAQILGGEVKPAKAREYGRAKLKIVSADPFVKGLPELTTVWMSHGDQIQELPADFVALASTPNCPFAAARH